MNTIYKEIVLLKAITRKLQGISHKNPKLKLWLTKVKWNHEFCPPKGYMEGLRQVVITKTLFENRSLQITLG